MKVIRVGSLPEVALDAAAAFHADVLPGIGTALGPLDPPQNGEGDHAKHGGGAPSGVPDLATSGSPPVPLHHPAGGPPPRAGEDMVIVFAPAPHDHRAWRLATIQDLARAASPLRVNAIVGSDEGAIAETLAFLTSAPGVTGQILTVDGKSDENA